MSQIELKDVNFAYEQGFPVIKNLSLSIKKGEYVAIVGKNGSGKSTLAKLLNGLLIPTGGSVTVDGFSTAEKKDMFEIRRRVGVVFQNPDNQLVASIVEDDVAFGPENIGLKREEIKERIDFALSAVGMEKYKRVSPNELSGGQKQRIAIAGVLALKPDVIVLDESTSMLDPVGREEVLAVAKKLNDGGTTVIAITHYMEETVNADRIVAIENGAVGLIGTPKEFFANTNLIEKMGLELPLATKIAERLKEKGLKIKDGVLTVGELGEILCKL